MSESPEETQKIDELKKLSDIATDMQLDGKLRIQSINLLGGMATHEALLVLLNLAANERLPNGERDHALKRARDIVKKSR